MDIHLITILSQQKKVEAALVACLMQEKKTKKKGRLVGYLICNKKEYTDQQ